MFRKLALCTHKYRAAVAYMYMYIVACSFKHIDCQLPNMNWVWKFVENSLLHQYIQPWVKVYKITSLLW